MTEKIYKKIARAPSHPGRVLKSGFVDQYGLRVDTVANLLGISRVHLSRILNAHKPVAPEIALKLELLTQTPASQWLALQSKYDMYMLEQGKGFKKYKKALNDWAAKSLPLEPEKRRVDKASLNLVAKVTKLASQIVR